MSSLSAVATEWLLLFLRCYCCFTIIPVLRAYLGHIGLIALASTLSALLVRGTNDENGGAIALFAAGWENALVGVLLGLPFAIALEVFGMGARVVDVSRGAQYGEQVNPLLGSRETSLETLAMLGVGLLFFQTELYQYLVVSLASTADATYHPIQLGEALKRSFVSGDIWTQLYVLANSAIADSVLIASAVVIVCLLVDVAGSILARSMPRVAVVVELLPLKLIVGLCTVAALTFIADSGVPESLTRSVELLQKFVS